MGCVIATGGSAVYSPAAMAHLKRHGTVVYLAVGLVTLEERVRDLDTRGLAKRPDQSFRDLYDERTPLYRKYADITIDCGGLTHEAVCARVMAALGERERGCPQ
jgi:shikimate kinase